MVASPPDGRSGNDTPAPRSMGGDGSAIAPSSIAAEPWPLLVLGEIVRGIPIALAAAIPLWAATMAGGVADALRGAQATVTAPTMEGRASPLGVPLSLLACALFLATGGPARIA